MKREDPFISSFLAVCHLLQSNPQTSNLFLHISYSPVPHHSSRNEPSLSKDWLYKHGFVTRCSSLASIQSSICKCYNFTLQLSHSTVTLSSQEKPFVKVPSGDTRQIYCPVVTDQGFKPVNNYCSPKILLPLLNINYMLDPSI